MKYIEDTEENVGTFLNLHQQDPNHRSTSEVLIIKTDCELTAEAYEQTGENKFNI